MNLRNWGLAHTKGFLIGIISPMVFIPMVIFLLAWLQDFHFSRLWYMFQHDEVVRSKVVSISIISNLIWFYLSINKEKYNFGMGVIIGTMAYLPYILYVNFFS